MTTVIPAIAGLSAGITRIITSIIIQDTTVTTVAIGDILSMATITDIIKLIGMVVCRSDFNVALFFDETARF